MLHILGEPGAGGARFPFIPPDNPDPMDDEFTDDTLSSKWVWINQAASVASIGHGGSLRLRVPPRALAGDEVRGMLVQPAPAPPWTFESYLGIHGNGSGTWGNGMVVHNTGNGWTTSFQRGFAAPASVSLPWVGITEWRALSTVNAALLSIAEILRGGTWLPVYQRIENTGTQLRFHVSFTGDEDNFTLLATRNLAGLMVAVTHVGFGGTVQNNGFSTTMRAYYFRRIA